MHTARISCSLRQFSRLLTQFWNTCARTSNASAVQRQAALLPVTVRKAC